MRKTIISLALVSLLSGCNDNTNSCIDRTPVVAKGDAFLDGIDLDMIVNQRTGVVSGLACHNCYDYNTVAVENTLRFIDKAVEENHQFIELDLIYRQEEGAWFINHGTNERFVALVPVLSRSSIKETNHSLFVEVKGDSYSQEEITQLFTSLQEIKNSFGDTAYFNQQRFLTVRSSADFSFINAMQDVLNEPRFSDIQHFVKFSKILPLRSFSSTYNRIELSKQCGVHMVEFSNLFAVDNIKNLAQHAKSIGLGTSMYTVDETNYKVFVKELQGTIDVFNIEPKRHEISAHRSTSLIDKIFSLLSGG